MYLSELLVINYRSCQKLHFSLQNNSPNILIGINDCGKSTILQAVGLLLEAKPRFNYKSDDKKKDDISNTRLESVDYNHLFSSCNIPSLPYTQKECIVVGKFMLETSDLNDDSNLSNHLLWAIEKSSDNCLWLGRVFHEETQKHSDFLLTPDTQEPSTHYKSNNTALTQQKKNLNITNEEIENENRRGRFTNLELVRAIYAKFEIAYHWVEYKIDKNFWLEYRYLDWNITLEQLTQFTNDAIKNRIEQQLKLASEFANHQAEQAQSIVNQALDDFTRQFATDIPNINSIKANVAFQVNTIVTDLLINKSNSDGDVHLDSQGDGIKRQLWFALTKWNAMNSVTEGVTDTKFIWCFDEPETHLYPRAQREFYDIIKTVTHTNVQSLISTHSTVFIDRAQLSSINKVDLINGYTITSKCETVDDIFQSLQIKNSDFLFYDKFLVVEGETEYELLPHLYRIYSGNSLIEDGIQIINLRGKDNRRQNQRILTNILDGFKKDTNSCIVYVFDNDARFEFTRDELSRITSFFVGIQDIEDSVSSTVWQTLVNSLIGETWSITTAEIDQLKSSIPPVDSGDASTKLQANQKFYPKLRSHVTQELNKRSVDAFPMNPLPNKGVDSGKLLANFITELGQIDPQIQQAFEKLMS